MAQGTTIKHKKKTKSVSEEYPAVGAPRGDQSHESHTGAHIDPPYARGADRGRHRHGRKAGVGDVFRPGQGDPQEDFDGEYGEPV